MHYEYGMNDELADIEVRDAPTLFNTDNATTATTTPQPESGTDKPTEIAQLTTRIQMAHASQLRMNL